MGHKLNIQGGYQFLSVLDSTEGNFAQALEHYKLYTLYKDSLLNEESNKQISKKTKIESKLKKEIENFIDGLQPFVSTDTVQHESKFIYDEFGPEMPIHFLRI